MPAQIVIRCEDLALLTANPDMLEAAKIRIERWSDNSNYLAFGLHVNPTDKGGWTEWHLVCDARHDGTFVQGQSMLIALIRRQPGAKVEAHS